MKKILWILLTGMLSLPATAQTDSLRFRHFSAVQLRADFNQLRQALEKMHPGLYRYASRSDMQHYMDSLYASLKDSTAFYDWYNTCTALTAYIRCAHTGAKPMAGFDRYYNHRTRFFPFSTHWIGDSVYISLNHTTDTTIKPFWQLLSINGRSMPAIRRVLAAHMSGDGEIQAEKKQQQFNLGMFQFLYYVHIERPDSFTITYRDDKGNTGSLTAAAATVPVINRRTGENPVNRGILKMYAARSEKNRKQPWRLDIIDTTGVLTIRTFGAVGKMDMGRFLDESMRTLQQKKIRRLIIDVRNNNGGADTLGVLLFRYLIHQPSRYYLRQYAVSMDSSYLRYSDLSEEEKQHAAEEVIPEPDGTFTLKAAHTAGVSLQYPAANAFTGKVMVLMNGASYSTASEFLGAVKASKAATLIGEECAGNYSGGNGGSFLHIPLAHTGVEVSIPLIYYECYTTPPVLPGRGALPDITVPDDIGLIKTGKDTQLEYALQLK
ncbi:hypothetical protein ECE50_028890 [Chitinophaga sp. Mgbs1]|uniref:Tail specific protease domain-containing protein n=1 Tax=Chitinophaga solisilvae TaxID=1233460 RepID=A0A9Q5GPE3_9BACT|nr:hypothetical protein [Chitinophaga solisilvae]